MGRVDAERALFLAFVAVLAWLPIPLGSNRAWAWAILEAGIFGLVAAWVALWALQAASLPATAIRARFALLVLAAFLLEQLLHVVPLPPSWVAILSPESARIQHLSDVLGTVRSTMTLSIEPQASLAALLKGLAYAGVFLLVLLLVDRRERVLLLVRVLVCEAVALSIYAVLMHLGGVRDVYFGAELNHGLQASGTYVNRNHFAGYLEMMLALGVGLLMAGLSERRAEGWKRLLAHSLDWILSPRMVLRLALCILVIALTTTHSRMGNGAFFASLLIAGITGISLSRRATRNTVILLASLVVIDLVIVGSWFGVEKVAQRLEETSLGQVRDREEPAFHAMPLIRDFAAFGSGPGTFYVAFPRYRPETVDAFFSAAHNDYVQFAAESGAAGLALLAAFVVMSLAAALRAQWVRRDPLMRGISFAAIMGVTSILIHSWVDFNLQIPANASYFMVLLALGWVSLHLGRE